MPDRFSHRALESAGAAPPRRGALPDLVVAAMGRRRHGRDAADLVSIEDEHGILSLEGGSWSFRTWDEIP